MIHISLIGVKKAVNIERCRSQQCHQYQIPFNFCSAYVFLLFVNEIYFSFFETYLTNRSYKTAYEESD